MPRIVRFHETGGPAVLKVENVVVPQPEAGEVQVRVKAFGLNHAELMLRAGRYVTTPSFPSRLGYEAAGTIEAVGPGVTDYAAGERVGVIPFLSADSAGRWTADSMKYGTYGELATLPADMVAHNPDNLSDLDCAAVWMQYLTAWGGLIEFAKIQAGETALITAASSSAAFGAVQIAKAEGTVVIATTRGLKRKSRLFWRRDPVGGPKMLGKRVIIRFHSIFDTARFADQRERAKAYVFERAKSGVLKPIVDRIFPMEQMPEAHRYMETAAQRGKIVVTV